MSTGTPGRRFLFAPETFNLGETSRGVEVARALARAGHDVRFMGYSRTYAPYIREAGFDLDLLAPEVDDALAARFFALAQGAFAALSVHHVHGAHPGVKRTGPDHALAT